MSTRASIGFVTTKAAPLHAGHIWLITQAATQCDILYVVLSHDGKRFDNPALSLKNRKLWLLETFKDIPHIRVVHVDETEMQPYPNGWDEWSVAVINEINEPHIDYIFTSEAKDLAGYNKWFPGTKVIMVDADRTHVPITGTMVRNEPMRHWSFMPSVVREQFLKRVCIIGTESCGKTTLTKMLAKHFQTSWVEEYGRTYCEQTLFGDETLLRFDDYGKIAMQRYQDECQAARSANRVLLVDTNALITNFYCRLYEGRTNPLVTELEAMEDYDLVIYLDDDVPWVPDGLRINSDRERTRNALKDYLQNINDKYSDKMVVVSGSYKQRLEMSIALIDNLLGVNAVSTPASATKSATALYTEGN